MTDRVLHTLKMANDDVIDRLDKSLSELMYNTPRVGFVFVTSDQIVQAINSQFSEIMGLEEGKSLIGLKVDEALRILKISDTEISESFDPSMIPTMMDESLNSSAPHWTQMLARTLDGRQIHINSWFNGRGEMLSIVRDISDDLRQTRLFEMAMDTANAGFWSLNFLTGKFTYSQSVLNRLTESEVDRLQNQGLWAIIHKDDLPEITRHWQLIVSGEKKFDLTYRVVTENEGEMWQRSVGQLERGSNGNIVGATAFVRDITNEINQHNDLVAERESSRAQSEFLARMSHEIRTPLNAIIGMADSLSDEPLTEDVRDVVNDIEQAADGLHGLLSRTLDHAKLVSNNMQINPISENPHRVIETCIKLWRPQCSNKGLTLNAHIDPAIPGKLLLDGFRIQQCLNNLVSNAIKFTESGRIDVVVKLANVKGREHIVLAVKDTGIGMSPEECGSIFKPFVQADGSISRQYGGTGLGMSIAKQLTELMGGTLKVKSKVGEGTTFAMILPILSRTDDVIALSDNEAAELPARQSTPQPKQITVPTAAAPTEAPVSKKIPNTELSEAMSRKDDAGRQPPLSAFQGLSVLCVEDNAMNQKVVQRLIGKRVSNLLFAGNGKEALQVLEVANVDVILMDIHMPIMNGIEATMEIRDSGKPWANVAIIALTADADYQQKSICRNIGMNETIAKPVKRQDILDAFDRVLKILAENHGQNIAISA